MNIYKVNYLTSVTNIKSIHVFYGKHDHDLEKMYTENPKSDIFTKIFTEEELSSIQSKNIPVSFTQQYLHEDDSIGTIKTKIAHELDNTVSIDEMYLFGMQQTILSSKFIHHILTQNNRVQLTRQRVKNFLSNVVKNADGSNTTFVLPDHSKARGSDVYTYDDLLSLQLDGKTYWVNKPLGQKYILQDGEYPYVCNPYELAHYDMNAERIIRRSASTRNNNILIHGGQIVTNNIYMCVASDVLLYSDTPTTIEIYYPILYNNNIRSLDALEERKYELRDKTKEKYNKELFEQVDLFYNIYQPSVSKLQYSGNGISSINLIIRQPYMLKIPTDVLFKIVHATKDIPYIKFNPGFKQEKMVRLFCENSTASGKKIPDLPKARISYFSKNLNTRNKSMSVFFQSIKAICEIDEQGDISIEIQEFDKLKTKEEIDALITKHINPFFENIQKYLQEHGYSIQIFNGLDDNNVELRSMQYTAVIPIQKNIQLTKIMGCISSIFVVENDNLADSTGIQMRMKRVSNFNKMTSMEAFIIEKQKEGLRNEDIVEKVEENYENVTREDAINLLGKLASETQIERGNRKNVIHVKSNPGLRTNVKLNSFAGEVNVNIYDINNIQFLNILPIYIESFIQLTQMPKTLPITSKQIYSICKSTNEDTSFNDIVAKEDLSYVEQQEYDEKMEEQHEDKGETYQVGQKEKIDAALDLFFADDDEEEEEEDDDENNSNNVEITGGDGENKESSIKSIEGMKLNNPDYFQKRIQERDPILILTRDEGRYKSYSRSCHKNVGRQPVILNQKELDTIEAQHPGFLRENIDIIKYGSKPDKQFYYICPRYWDLEKNTIVTPQEIKDKKLEDKIIPVDAKSVPPGKYIYEFNAANPKEYKADRQLYPGFMVDKHPDNYCLPCCFEKWDVTFMKQRKKQCTGEDDQKKDVITKKDEYIQGPGKFPLIQGKWGYLPTSVQHMIGHKQTTCKPNKLCLLRHGVESSKNKSFIACIADAICYTKRPVMSIQETIDVIVSTINIDNFASYQNGSLIDEFYDQNTKVDINQAKYQDTKLYVKTRNDPEKEAFFKRVCVSMTRFINFLRDDKVTVDYTYLWDLLSTPHSSIFPDGINLVILQSPSNDITDNINIVCPTNHYTSKKYTPNKPTLILYSEDNYYEPIFTYRTTLNTKTNQATILVGKFFREQFADEVPEIKYIFEMIIKPYYDKLCKPLPSMPKTYTAKHPILLRNLIEICKERKYTIGNQVMNYQGKVIGIMVKSPALKNYIFVPCYPSSIEKEYDFQFMLDSGIWNTYKTTVDSLQLIHKETEYLVPCAPIFKVIEDEVVVGIITETNQFIQLSNPEPLSNTSDNLKELRNNNFMITENNQKVSGDVILTSSTKVDEERIEYVKKIKLETEFYQAFRTTIRTLLNDPKYYEQRIQIEKETSQIAILYSTKLSTTVTALKNLADKMVLFVKDYNYKLINEIHTCIVNKDKDKCKAETPLCSVSSNGDCQIIIPKVNLLNGTDNEKNYYLKMADELIRYRRIRQFMFQPEVYLSFGRVDYHIDDHEIMIMQSMLNNDFFDGLIGKRINNYSLHTSYDNAEPQISQTYVSQVKV